MEYKVSKNRWNGNNLTQITFAFSRDNVTKFLPY